MDSFSNGDLWDGSIYPNAPGHRHVETSVEAADAIAPKLGRLQKAALAAITARGALGLTADELAEALSCDRYSIQPRSTELRVKGLIVDSGLRRLNASGRRAIVWTLPKFKLEGGKLKSGDHEAR
jgi:hypothetical protein